jgi:hypothetical protein
MKLTSELGLIPVSLYQKVEATAEDMMLVLTTLWTRAEDIPLSPLKRVSVANAMIQMSTGGFRPRTIEDTNCRQYTISLVRDPKDETRIRPVVTHNMKRSKTKKADLIGTDSTQTS